MKKLTTAEGLALMAIFNDELLEMQRLVAALSRSPNDIGDEIKIAVNIDYENIAKTFSPYAAQA